jgi:hypothetical protein
MCGGIDGCHQQAGFKARTQQRAARSSAPANEQPARLRAALT